HLASHDTPCPVPRAGAARARVRARPPTHCSAIGSEGRDMPGGRQTRPGDKFDLAAARDGWGVTVRKTILNLSRRPGAWVGGSASVIAFGLVAMRLLGLVP